MGDGTFNKLPLINSLNSGGSQLDAEFWSQSLLQVSLSILPDGEGVQVELVAVEVGIYEVPVQAHRHLI